jgi:uncharacterized protein involved in exopolysaccharide biosynthesis
MARKSVVLTATERKAATATVKADIKTATVNVKAAEGQIKTADKVLADAVKAAEKTIATATKVHAAEVKAATKTREAHAKSLASLTAKLAALAPAPSPALVANAA